ncbi:ArsR family transcriptional regulator [Mycobacterium sp. IS-1742]|uniref:ArsR/SmtB family transcription factor n=1 Tax=Mycobacterium sp. IS-1742 TaxID=1772285 RepID=UPI0007403406|nr:metalloregulator ArsR/SmtB family transcription factor [Mycobacterium sp. IS-1742]KUI32402.1 ArsR family transcriptional regulator [Mycobacterium sp. IS-1742]
MDEVFKALADPSRRRLLDALNLRDGQTLRELSADLDMTRQSVTKHLAVLEAAGLVTTVRRGREKLHHLDAEPINALFDRWIRQYDRVRSAPSGHDTAPQAPPMPPDRQAFVYTTYIRTTPERLWQAITGPSFSGRYMGHAVVSTWQKGATYTWIDGDRELDDPGQVILEADPYQRLAFTFPAAVASMTDAPTERLASEPHSRVSFDIAPHDDQVELTVVHDEFSPKSSVQQHISRIWPQKLADLKSGLEHR